MQAGVPCKTSYLITSTPTQQPTLIDLATLPVLKHLEHKMFSDTEQKTLQLHLPRVSIDSDAVMKLDQVPLNHLSVFFSYRHPFFWSPVLVSVFVDFLHENYQYDIFRLMIEIKIVCLFVCKSFCTGVASKNN